jgi:hypothetical protein
MASQMGFTLFPETYVTTPDSVQLEAFVIRDAYEEVATWYEQNLEEWSVTETFDLRDEYDEPDAGALYGYKRLEADGFGGLVFYRGMETDQMGAVSIILHAQGSAAAIEETTINPPAVDIASGELPRFVTHTLVDPAEPTHISHFRSGYGHSYTNDFETCRTMKHYLSDAGGSDGKRELQYAPTDGIVTQLDGDDVAEDADDYRVVISPAGHPAFTLELFHVDPAEKIVEGYELTAGEEIGRFASDGMTVGEPAVNVQTPTGRTLVSFYEVMGDEAFSAYQDRGVQSRDDLIYSEAYRDDHPIQCEQDGHGTGDYTEQVGGAGFDTVNHFTLS